ncbi:2-dehydropantoate 2-reductase [Weissella thailandensis]|uniref:2-dehydropantoate 2-reductase n=1 Tax=Weissella thailandensis TaxID=89061 RepID=A0ABX9I5L3_9LACO|nr:2-dehydropantoate 2-reductase [Weissella thailandensis]NKY90625.1 2-dehydropantoate 2-reductase [Weissella thailandensis]RDS59976.1 2-dehydropantoate 2-reductase [Weissella thailandensis]GEP73937.1 2-dehydropantoate 2-reductase [Weissella thailandensis]
MKIAIAGSGAMGSRFGYMLHQAGNQVTLIDLWSEHIATINTKGLSIETAGKQQFVKIPAAFPEDVNDDFDLVLLFTKATQLNDMLNKISHLLTDNTAVLCLSNGIGNLETIKKFNPHLDLLVGTTLWTSELIGPGTVVLNGSGYIEFQAVGNVSHETVIKVNDVLNKADLDARPSNNVLLSIWKKACLNSVLNTFCTILDCKIMDLRKSQYTPVLAKRVVDEFEAVAQAKGIPLTAELALKTINSSLAPDQAGDHYPSMHQDIASGRHTEIDYLNGAIARMGKELNIPTPTNTLITELIHAREDVVIKN